MTGGPKMLVFKRRDGSVVADRVARADTFASRAVGLLARSRLAAGEGLLFAPGGSVHTVGMRFAIDVLFLDEQLCVLKACSDVPPWRVCAAPLRTRYTLELSAGQICKSGTDCGTRLLMEEVSHA